MDDCARGAAAYKVNRSHSKKPHKIENCGPFVDWVCEQVRTNLWSLDACVGYAKAHNLFPKDETVCIKTLYNEVRADNLPIHLPEQFGDKLSSVFQTITAEEILAMSDGINALPRRKLGYRTPEERFDDFLDEIYAV